MTKLKFVRFVATMAASLGLVGGMSAVAFASDHHDHNKGNNSFTLNADNGNVSNKNKVGVANLNSQETTSGNVNVSGGSNKGHDEHNNDNSGGSVVAASGDVSAANDQSATVDIASTAQASGPAVAPSVSGGGEGGSNAVLLNADNGNVSNNNQVGIVNASEQNTSSGDVHVSGNQGGGSVTASSGDVSSSSTQDASVSISQ